MKVAKFCSFFENHWPSVPEIRPFFERYDRKEWSRGGEGQSLVLYGAEGTENLEPFKDRIDIHLAVYDDPECGALLMYDKTGGKYSEHYYSLGDSVRFYETVKSREGSPLSKGLFVPLEQAWLAVEDFLLNEGQRSGRIHWIQADELSPDVCA